jgi:organic radical activating enzyme
MFDRFNPQLKLASNENFSKFLRGEKVYPINIEISPSHTCNAKCPWCFYAGTHIKKNIGMMDTKILIQLINDLAKLGLKSFTWTGGGEPTLHPDFSKLSKLVHSHGIKQGLFTNALLKPTYDPLLFEWIRVSNTERDWPEANIKWLRDKTKVLGMAYNYAGNDEEVYESLRIGKEIKVDYVQIRQALNLRGLVTERQPPNIKDPILFITKYKFDDSSNPHGYTKCYGFNFVPFVWYNGNVDVCGYMNKCGAPYTLGNLNFKSIKEIMDEAPRHVPVVGTCQVCCKNHLINKLVNEALELKDGEFV